jgi:hypothetical protein
VRVSRLSRWQSVLQVATAKERIRHTGVTVDQPEFFDIQHEHDRRRQDSQHRGHIQHLHSPSEHSQLHHMSGLDLEKRSNSSSGGPSKAAWGGQSKEHYFEMGGRCGGKLLPSEIGCAYEDQGISIGAR